MQLSIKARLRGKQITKFYQFFTLPKSNFTTVIILMHIVIRKDSQSFYIYNKYLFLEFEIRDYIPNI